MFRCNVLTLILLVGCVDKEPSADGTEMPIDGSAPTASSTSDSGKTSLPTDAGRDSSAPDPSALEHCAPLFSVHSDESPEAAAGLCDALPPACETGTVAELYTVDGNWRECWTGRCLPARECDLVNDCRDCAADTYCYLTVDEGNNWRPPALGADAGAFNGQNLIRVECLPLDECADGKCDDCEEIFCFGGCNGGPLRSEYDNEFTGNLVDHSDDAFVCTTYDG